MSETHKMLLNFQKTMTSCEAIINLQLPSTLKDLLFAP